MDEATWYGIIPHWHLFSIPGFSWHGRWSVACVLIIPYSRQGILHVGSNFSLTCFKSRDLGTQPHNLAKNHSIINQNRWSVVPSRDVFPSPPLPIGLTIGLGKTLVAYTYFPAAVKRPTTIRYSLKITPLIWM